MQDTPQRSSRVRGVDIAIVAAIAVACALILGLVGGALGLGLAMRATPEATSAASPFATRTPGPTDPESVAGVVRDVLPSVASVIVDAGFESGSGSGFVLRDNYVVTNSHVIDAALANDGRVEIVLSDGRRLPAGIVGRNVSYDVAVLRVDDGALRALPVATAPVEVGDSVIVIGAPLGYDFTVTQGIVSAVDRPVTVGEAEETSYISAIQTDASINPGNSGGPVIDGDGAFVGMASSIATLAAGGSAGNIGLGFAIPARAVVRISEEIIATGSSRTPIMGVTIDPRFEGPGALLATVTPDGAAAAAGLAAGDVVVRFGNRVVRSADELVVAIRDRLPGEEVEVEVLREGRSRVVTLVLGSREDR